MFVVDIMITFETIQSKQAAQMLAFLPAKDAIGPRCENFLSIYVVWLVVSALTGTRRANECAQCHQGGNELLPPR
jgi:hypothetical protein